MKVQVWAPSYDAVRKYLTSVFGQGQDIIGFPYRRTTTLYRSKGLTVILERQITNREISNLDVTIAGSDHFGVEKFAGTLNALSSYLRTTEADDLETFLGSLDILDEFKNQIRQ